MKKIYFAPETKVVKTALHHILAASPGNVTLDKNATKITDGAEIGSRGFDGFWDDEED